MADFILDASVFVADFLQEEDADRALKARRYLQRIRSRRSKAHVPTLMLVEVCGAVRKRVQPTEAALSAARAAKSRLVQLERDGHLIVYSLNRSRTDQAIDIATRYGISGADATYAALAEELSIELVTFDENSLANPLRRGGYTRVVVPT